MRGLPVACSDAASLPEVAGEAALYFDPTGHRRDGEAIGSLLARRRSSRAARRGRPRACRRLHLAAGRRGTVACYERALAS